MKFLRIFSTFSAAAILATAMSVSASAATWEEVVDAAEECGVQALNVQQLSNFLEYADSVDYFTEDDYDYMISVMQDVCDTYVVDLAMELFGKTPAELTEDEKVQLGKNWSAEDREAIINALLALGEKYDVEINVDALVGDYDTTSQYTVEASITLPTSSTDDSDTSSSSSNSSTATATVVKTTDAVAATGTSEADSSAAGVVGAAVGILALTTAGVIVVAKKNKG